jgi:hypothetical protein
VTGHPEISEPAAQAVSVVGYTPLVSIVIPTRNESEDIRATIEACLAISHSQKEVVVVDDSVDDTPRIVTEYADRGVRLVRRSVNTDGCCGARNLGIQEAAGEIVVLLNADAVPRPDFLERIARHYAAGADYVIVRSTVLNSDCIWGQLVEAEARRYLARKPDMEWSEGFSCRRSAALEVGLIPGRFPVNFCRDWRLGAALSGAGKKKHVDLEIPMEHVVPPTAGAFFRHSIWRGTMLAPASYFLAGRSLITVGLHVTARAAQTALRHLFVFPALLSAVRLAGYLSGGPRLVVKLWGALFVRDAGVFIGLFRGLLRVVRSERQPRKRR